MKTFSERIREASGGAVVAVAFSGGLDSTVLLHAACEALPSENVVAIHVDHGLRAGSESDARWAREQARQLGIRCSVVRLNLPTANKQANARMARYAAIGRQMHAFGAARVMTAHHADDAVESALERLSRGSGLSAVTGLRPAAQILGIDVRRPFLEVGRLELEQWAAARGLVWREDPSNAASDYDRNAIRNRALPVLTRQRGPEPLQRSVVNLRAEAAVVEGAVTNLVDAATLPAPGRRSVRLDRRWLAAAGDTMRRLTLLRAVEPLQIFLERVHLDAILGLEEPEGVAWLDLPGGRVGISHTQITFSSDPLTPRETSEVEVRLEEEPNGALPWFDHVVIWETFADEATLMVPEDATLVVAGPRPGARIELEAGTRKVTDVLREAGVSPEDRWSWPCIYLGESCICIVGLRTTAVEHGQRRISVRSGERTRTGMTP